MKKDNLNEMFAEIAKYIKTHGGEAVVVGPISISKRPPLKNNFTLHIDFVGKAPKKQDVWT